SEGHPGQKYAKGADQPVWRKAVHFGQAREFFPGSPRQLGQEYVEDAKRPVQPKQRTFVWDIRAKNTRGTRRLGKAANESEQDTCPK
ncbi:hypothetical protein KI387_027092, partial [Taxus chinensis]